MQKGGTTFASRLERYEKQRIEWINGLQRIITPTVEELIRSMLDAAIIVATRRPQEYNTTKAFYHLVKDTRTWSEEKFDDVIGRDKVKDADTCLLMTVRSHSIIMALSTGNRPNATITMPSIYKFFRQVFEDSVEELSPPNSGLFVKSSSEEYIRTRESVRNWIDGIVSTKALSLVPISLFANLDKKPKPSVSVKRVATEFEYIPPAAEQEDDDDDDDEEEDTPPKKEAAPAPATVVAIPPPPIPLPPPPPLKEEEAPKPEVAPIPVIAPAHPIVAIPEEKEDLEDIVVPPLPGPVPQKQAVEVKKEEEEMV